MRCSPSRRWRCRWRPPGRVGRSVQRQNVRRNRPKHHRRPGEVEAMPGAGDVRVVALIRARLGLPPRAAAGRSSSPWAAEPRRLGVWLGRSAGSPGGPGGLGPSCVPAGDSCIAHSMYTAPLDMSLSLPADAGWRRTHQALGGPPVRPDLLCTGARGAALATRLRSTGTFLRGGPWDADSWLLCRRGWCD